MRREWKQQQRRATTHKASELVKWNWAMHEADTAPTRHYANEVRPCERNDVKNGSGPRKEMRGNGERILQTKSGAFTRPMENIFWLGRLRGQCSCTAGLCYLRHHVYSMSPRRVLGWKQETLSDGDDVHSIWRTLSLGWSGTRVAEIDTTIKSFKMSSTNHNIYCLRSLRPHRKSCRRRYSFFFPFYRTASRQRTRFKCGCDTLEQPMRQCGVCEVCVLKIAVVKENCSSNGSLACATRPSSVPIINSFAWARVKSKMDSCFFSWARSLVLVLEIAMRQMKVLGSSGAIERGVPYLRECLCEFVIHSWTWARVECRRFRYFLRCAEQSKHR